MSQAASDGFRPRVARALALWLAIERLYDRTVNSAGGLAREASEAVRERMVEQLAAAAEASPRETVLEILSFLSREIPAAPEKDAELVELFGRLDCSGPPTPASSEAEPDGAPRPSGLASRWVGPREIAQRLSISVSAVGNILRAGGLAVVRGPRGQRGTTLSELHAAARPGGGREGRFLRASEVVRRLGPAAARALRASGVLPEVHFAGMTLALFATDRVEELRRNSRQLELPLRETS